MAFSNEVLHGAPLSRESFARPPRGLGILPFWFWNGEMDEREMEWQLKEYHAKGIPGIFIHGRFGLKIPYASDAWFEKVKVAVAQAKAIGIDAWVYDEMNWPSGTAERKVPSQYPHLTQKYLELVALNVDGPLFTFLEATDDRYVNTGDSYPVAAIGCTEEEYQTVLRNPIDLTHQLSFERVLPWEAPPGKWRLLYFLQKEVPYYIDALNPESTERFIGLTHERYRQAVGTEFGTVVPGFYTDEPAMHYYHVGVDNYVIPWTSQMFKIFRERRGYDLRPLLPALYLNMGPNTARVRYDFWRTLTEQYAQTYYGRLRAWCDEHGVIFTGHLLFEEWLRMHARCEGNLFSYLKHMHLIGVDHLYPKIGTEEEPDQHVAIKIASSAAHHFGSTRLLCESMGGAYWDCTLQRMRWIANWEYVLGVNLFNNHGYHYSIEGERKRDWPPSQFYHHTWWKYYSQFTDYMTRMSHLLSGGRHVAKVLVLYPLTSIWTNYVPQARTEIGNIIESEFAYLTDTLLRLHYDFDYVDENVLAEARVEQGRLHIHDEQFEVCILPPLTHVRKSTFDVLDRFVKSGGHLIADTLLPSEFLEADTDRAATRVERLFGMKPADLERHFRESAVDRVWVHRAARRRGSVTVFRGKGLQRGRGKNILQQSLDRCISPDVRINDDDVFYLHRVKDGHDIYYLVNTALTPRPGLEISFEHVGVPEMWELSTGDIRPIPQYSIRKGRLLLRLDFAPAEAHVVVMRNGKSGPHVVDANFRVESIDGTSIRGHSLNGARRSTATVVSGRRTVRRSVPAPPSLKPIRLPARWLFSCEGDNALLLTSWKMLVDAQGTIGPDVAHPLLNDSGWLSVRNGAWEMQLPQERDAATYPVSLWYRTMFDAAFLPTNLRALIDGFSGSDYRLFVNGEEVRDRGKRSSLDAEIMEVDIARHVVNGTNCVAVQLTVTRRTDGILDPLKLVGDFAVRGVGENLVIVPPERDLKVGDWTKFGYPFFSGTGVYRGEFRLPKTYVGGKLVLDVSCGDDVLEVSVNDHASVVLPWAPYRIDVSDVVHPGANSITLKVTNTLINLLEGVQQPSGLRAQPVIRHHHRVVVPL